MITRSKNSSLPASTNTAASTTLSSSSTTNNNNHNSTTTIGPIRSSPRLSRLTNPPIPIVSVPRNSRIKKVTRPSFDRSKSTFIASRPGVFNERKDPERILNNKPQTSKNYQTRRIITRIPKPTPTPAPVKVNTRKRAASGEHNNINELTQTKNLNLTSNLTELSPYARNVQNYSKNSSGPSGPGSSTLLDHTTQLQPTSTSKTYPMLPLGSRSKTGLDFLKKTKFDDTFPVNEAVDYFLEFDKSQREKFLSGLVDKLNPKELLSLNWKIEPKLRRDILSDLPKELRLHLFGYLHGADLATCCRVSKKWLILASEPRIWRALADHDDVEIVKDKKGFYKKHRTHMNWLSNSHHHLNFKMPKEYKQFSGFEDFLQHDNPLMLNYQCHDDHVITCLLCDKTRIISGSDDGTINVWDTFVSSPESESEEAEESPENSPQQKFQKEHYAKTGFYFRAKLIGHKGGVWSADIYENLLISGSTDREIRGWDLSNFTPKFTIKGSFVSGHTGTVRCLSFYKGAFEASRGYFVSGSRDNLLKLWQPIQADRFFKSDQIREASVPYTAHTGIGHTGAVRCVAWSPCGQKIYSGGYDFDVRVWKIIFSENNEVTPVTSFTCTKILRGHQDRIYTLEVTPDGNNILSGGQDNFIKVWDSNTGELKYNLPVNRSLTSGLKIVNTRAFSRPVLDEYGRAKPGRKRQVLFSVSADSKVMVYDVETGLHLNIIDAQRPGPRDPFQPLVGRREDITSIEIIHCPYTIPWEFDTLKNPTHTYHEVDSTLLNPASLKYSTNHTYYTPNLLLVASTDNGSVLLFDAVTGTFIRELISLRVSRNANIWRLRVEDDKLICAAGGRHQMEGLSAFPTQVLVCDYRDRK